MKKVCKMCGIIFYSTDQEQEVCSICLDDMAEADKEEQEGGNDHGAT